MKTPRPPSRVATAAILAVLLVTPALVACNLTSGGQPAQQQEIEDCDDWEDGCGYIVTKRPTKITKTPQPRSTRRR